MGLSVPLANDLDAIAVNPVLKILGINPMDLSAPWADSIDIIAL